MQPGESGRNATLEEELRSMKSFRVMNDERIGMCARLDRVRELDIGYPTAWAGWAMWPAKRRTGSTPRQWPLLKSSRPSLFPYTIRYLVAPTQTAQCSHTLVARTSACSGAQKADLIDIIVWWSTYLVLSRKSVPTFRYEQESD